MVTGNGTMEAKRVYVRKPAAVRSEVVCRKLLIKNPECKALSLTNVLWVAFTGGGKREQSR